MSGYEKSYDGETKWMYYLIEDDELLEKYNDIGNKAISSIKNKFHSDPIYNQIKFYGDEAADFHDKEMPKVGSN